jgi:hypothetical protein
MPVLGSLTWASWLGLVFFVVSCFFYAVLILVPFLPISAAIKLALAPALVAMGEAAFWIGAAIVGKEVISRYRRFLDPRRWLSKGKESPE